VLIKEHDENIKKTKNLMFWQNFQKKMAFCAKKSYTSAVSNIKK
jgi:hypothetical protein